MEGDETRRLLIAGNWKMKTLLSDGVHLAESIAEGIEAVPEDRDVLVCPPYTIILPVRETLEGTRVQLGGQDLFYENLGAFTGAICAAMLRDLGCTYVLVGHSERRIHFGDGGPSLRRKIEAAAEQELIPVYCVGENLEERERDRTSAVLRGQIEEVLGGLEECYARAIVVAYEPVWAIGTGRTATPEIAQEAQGFLRDLLAQEWGSSIAAGVQILYGGSVTEENASVLLSQPDVDGLLIGGASLAADSFLKIARARVLAPEELAQDKTADGQLGAISGRRGKVS